MSRSFAAFVGMSVLVLFCLVALTQQSKPQHAPQNLTDPRFTPPNMPGVPPLDPRMRSRKFPRPGGIPASPDSLNASSIFVEAPEYDSGGYSAYSIAVADVNQDGKPDLLVVNYCEDSNCTDGGVGVRLGNGDGTFASAVSYGSGGYAATSIAVGDVNRDGKPDLLVANYCAGNNNCNGTVGVLLGNGDGTFASAVSYGSGGYGAYSIAVGDVNGDGKPDLLVANQCASGSDCTGALGVLLGNGDGTFQVTAGYSSGGYQANSIAVGDVDGDGKPDLLVANQCASSSNCSAGGVVTMLLGNGDGTFQAGASYASGGYGAYSIAVEDVNGDGKPDLLVADSCVSYSSCASGEVGVLLGNGDGTFQAAVSYSSGGVYAASIAVGDVNGDGKPDLLVANQCVSSSNCTGAVGVLLGNGDGTFQAAVSYASGGYGAYSIAVGDVNGDGNPDLLVANQCASSSDCTGGVGVLLGNGDGTFPAAVSYDSGGYTNSIAVGDVNGDGKPDLLVANQCASSSCSNGSVGVVLGNGDGTFQAAVSYSSGGVYAASIAVGDVNGDGKPDLLVANQCVSSSNCSTGGAGVLLGNGDGTFQTAVSYASGGLTSFSIAVADVNGDGKPDLLVTNRCADNNSCGNGGTVGVLLGIGDGTFQAAVSYSSGGYGAVSLAVGDVSGDGKPDLLVVNQCVSSSNCSNGTLGVLLGNGDGTFQSAVTYGSGGYIPWSIAVGDVNGDGNPDLLMANQCSVASRFCSSGGTVGVLLGNGDGTFQAAVSASTPNLSPGQLVVGDFDGDGNLDAASGSGNFLLLGNGDGTFQPYITLGAGGPGIATGDFNRDGSPDLAVGGVTILLNRVARVQPTNMTLSSSLNPSVYGQSVTLSASITANASGGSIIGSVAWSANTGCGTTTVTPGNPGIATCTTSTLNAGNNPITATYSGDTAHSGSIGTLSGGQVVNQAGQTITCSGIPASAAYNSAFTVSCTATSGLAVAYTSSGSCSNVGATYTMTSGAGSCSVIADQSGNGNYTAALEVVYSVTAAKSTPTVTFTGLPAILPYGNTYTLTATTNASTTASITDPTSLVCSLSGTTVTILKPSGLCKVTATWAADSNYNAATLTQTGTAKKAVAAITWAPPAPITYGTALSSTQLDATATPSSIFPTAVYSPAAGKFENAGTNTLKVTFTPTDTVHYATTTASVTLQVLPAATTTAITSPNQTVKLNKTTGTASATVKVNVTSYKPTGTVTLTTTPAGPTCTGTVTALTGNGQCKLTFNTTGTWTINAAYSGDANHTVSDNSGQSPAITVTVN